MKTELVTGFMAIFFGIIGSWGLVRQSQAIWRSKSAKSVSGIWVVTFLSMFLSWTIYGFQKGSFPLQFQGLLRVIFSIPVVVGFVTFGTGNWKFKILCLVYTALLIMMSLSVMVSVVFTLISSVAIVSSFHQAYTIFCNKSRGRVVLELQIIYLLAVICWAIYGFVRSDAPLVATSIGFAISYLTTISMWIRYR